MTFGDDHGTTADRSSFELTLLDIEPELDETGTTHFETLLDQHGDRTVIQLLEGRPSTSKRGRRRARRRVFPDAEAWREHPGMDVGRLGFGLVAVDIDGDTPGT